MDRDEEGRFSASVSDDELSDLKEQTAGGDRIETALSEQRRRELIDEFRPLLEKTDTGELQKTVSVWDGPFAAYVAALVGETNDDPGDVELRTELADGLADELDWDIDDPERSDIVRLLLRAGLQSAAPDHLVALRESVREQAVEDL